MCANKIVHIFIYIIVYKYLYIAINLKPLSAEVSQCIKSMH